MTVPQYIEQIKKLYKTGLSSEHSYRGDLLTLIESIVPEVMVTNEPKRIACGAPDYIITRNEIPVGYIEAKDLGKDIGHKDYKEQFDRYKKSLNNLIITDYINFWLYIDGELKIKIKIAEIVDRQLKSIPENFEQFKALIKAFCTHTGQNVKSASKLSKMMADKAKLLAEIIERALDSDVENEEDSTLKEQMQAFKDILIHDITSKEFADIYSQTIAYGMFAARLHDTTLETFTRQKAAELIPKTNPFLRKLFQYVAGYDLDSRIAWIVDALADIFRATDVAALLQNFGKYTQINDPIIHFYETFLAEYDPALRKSRGVWYTPEPVVNFIVRAVDDILKTEFNLPEGLADYSKIKVKKTSVTKATADQRSKIKEVETEIEVHKVQILDPATGTGTFLAEVVKQVYSKFKGQQGIWNNYVENHLIPRLNGFELLMASYAMAHLKLDMLLAETGYKSMQNQRFRIYLTNSLEEYHQDTGTLFANWLSSEANEANHIKRDTPVMVVIGNPPYSVSSSNKSDWIENLTIDYKKNLNEKNIQPLSDDYIKFIRFGQHFIDKNGEGILAYISNNSFIDGIIHKQMRKHLLESFDKVYILDLHGNSKKREIDADGNIDQNVFDIMQGVSINIFIKNGQKKVDEIGKVFLKGVFGKRESKYNLLQKSSIKSLDWKEIVPIPNDYLFVQQNNEEVRHYNEFFFGINELFLEGSNGTQTKRDDLFVDFGSITLKERIKYLLSKNLSNEFIEKFQIMDSSSYFLLKKIRESHYYEKYISKYLYRPLDFRYIYYDKNLLGRAFYRVLRNLDNKKNYALIIGRQGQAVGGSSWNLVSITNVLLDTNLFYRGGNMAYPLYLYPEAKTEEFKFETIYEAIPNLDKSIICKFEVSLGLKFDDNKNALDFKNSFSALEILDYLYSILHSLNYRKRYKEFLKKDFPRIPYPKDKDTFWQLVAFGRDLRRLHLLESDQLNKFITTYPQNGNNIVTFVKYEENKVLINENQYFDGVPEVAWNFYIGGYQPAQKWLKDRKSRELNIDDILHYQRIIVAITETGRLMKEIDAIQFE